MLTEAELKALQQALHLAKNPYESDERSVECTAIIYISPTQWTVWLNNSPIHQSDQILFLPNAPPLRITKVEETKIYIEFPYIGKTIPLSVHQHYSFKDL